MQIFHSKIFLGSTETAMHRNLKEKFELRFEYINEQNALHGSLRLFNYKAVRFFKTVIIFESEKQEFFWYFNFRISFVD